MKLMNNDLLDEERLVNRKAPKAEMPYASSAMTFSFNDSTYKASYEPDKYQEKIYSAEDMDKVIAMLTLFIDDHDTRIQLEEVYQSWKDTGKI